MKAKFGAIVVDGRGKLGGHVASKNRAGSFFRTKVTPTNPNTAAQVLSRSRLATLSTSWAGLTDAQRAAWNSATELWKSTNIFGDLKNPSGFNLYQRLNNNLAQVGVAAMTNPPLPAAIGNWSTFSFVPDNTSTMVLTFAATPVPAGFAVLIDGTAPCSPGIKNANARFRRITSLAAAVATGVDIQANYVAKFGSIAPIGNRVFLRAKYVNIATGQVGLPVEATAIIQA
ncbi:hypothetical protein EHM76_02570 [bacterium]|nr:MAG: hypothetical protein EHM76_02570 [bacterium]